MSTGAFNLLSIRTGEEPESDDQGDPLPSVRTVAAEYRVNHLTVLKGYQELVDEQLVESRRGLGMFVNVGARDLLLRGEREKFLTDEWPRVYETIQRLIHPHHVPGVNPQSPHVQKPAILGMVFDPHD